MHRFGLAAALLAGLAVAGPGRVTAPAAAEIGLRYYRRHTRDDYRIAVKALKAAIAKAPRLFRAHAALAWVYWESHQRAWHEELGLATAVEARDLAKNYLGHALEAPTPLALALQAVLLRETGRHDSALRYARRAVARAPEDRDARVALAQELHYAGRAAEAMTVLEAMTPRGAELPARHAAVAGMAYFQAGDYSRAAAHLEGNERWPVRNRVVLAASYGHLGRKAAARRIVAELTALAAARGTPPFRAGLAEDWSYADRDSKDRLRQGLLKAGMEE
jgi:tetratricopeptide (TPR) repeat protein